MGEYEPREIDYGSYARELHVGEESRVSNAGIAPIGVFIDTAGDPLKPGINETPGPEYLKQS